MKDIVIIGAGGFGREVAWLIERINKLSPMYNILGFIDDSVEVGSTIGRYSVIGNIDSLEMYSEDVNITIGIGNSQTRKKIVERINKLKKFKFPNLIDPSSFVEKENLGSGNIICANNVFTIDYTIGDFVIVNLACTIGHDAKLNDYVTMYPGVNLSGCTDIGSCTELGTGSKIIQGIKIGNNTIVGAGAVVNREIPNNVTAVGVPAKVIKLN